MQVFWILFGPGTALIEFEGTASSLRAQPRIAHRQGRLDRGLDPVRLGYGLAIGQKLRPDFERLQPR